jgi:DNA-binding GntR family transcriptional regulator
MLNIPDQRLVLQAYEKILEMIMYQQIQPGDLLNERRLAEMLDMSRTPARDALLILKGEGLLLRQGQRGLQVRRIQVDDFLDALQVRLLLEPAVALMAAGKVAGDILDALEDDLKAVLNNAGLTGTDVDREQTRRIDEHLHGVITSIAGNPKLSSIVLELRRLTQFFDLESLLERVTDTCNEHMEIIAALRMGDGERAARTITFHLDQVRASIIARLFRA